MKIRMTFILLFISASFTAYGGVKLKTLARLAGLQENPLSGYGLVIGLAGSGDSRRNKDTTQAIANLLQNFGLNVNPNEINSRNTATVIVTASLPSYAHQGDKIDINVASLGDAKSLLGGTLLVTPLQGTDNRIYALAQGPISIGGFKYDLYGNVIQKNHPTTGIISNGAVVEKTLYNDLVDKTGDLHLILNHPDFSTADRIEEAINREFGPKSARARSAQDIEIHPPLPMRQHFIHFISKLENLAITPDNLLTVVVNERTGVIVAGANVHIDAVVISYGNLHIAIASEFNVSQPTLLFNMGKQVRTAITPSTHIDVKEPLANTLNLQKGATVADLIGALAKLQTPTRDMIAVLETLQRAGALHAELIIQ